MCTAKVILLLGQHQFVMCLTRGKFYFYIPFSAEVISRSSIRLLCGFWIRQHFMHALCDDLLFARVQLRSIDQDVRFHIRREWQETTHSAYCNAGITIPQQFFYFM